MEHNRLSEDINAFWKETLAELAEVPMAAEVFESAPDGVIDGVHPYRTIVPVFERMPTQKSIVVYPDIEHGTRADFARHIVDWLDRYIR